MFVKVLIAALVASPLVAAHGKVSVVVSTLLAFIINGTDIPRLVMQAEIPPPSESKVPLFPVLVLIPRPKSTPPSSTALQLHPMAWAVLRDKERTRWLACLLSLPSPALHSRRSAKVEVSMELCTLLPLMVLDPIPVCDLDLPGRRN